MKLRALYATAAGYSPEFRERGQYLPSFSTALTPGRIYTVGGLAYAGPDPYVLVLAWEIAAPRWSPLEGFEPVSQDLPTNWRFFNIPEEIFVGCVAVPCVVETKAGWAKPFDWTRREDAVFYEQLAVSGLESWELETIKKVLRN